MMQRCVLNGIVLLLLAAPTGAASPAQEIPEWLRTRTLADVDSMLDSFRQMTWSMPAGLGNPQPRPDGSSLQADIDRFLQTDATLAEFMRTRRRLADGQAEDGSLPGEGLLDFVAQTQREMCRFSAVAWHWAPDDAGIAHHTGLIQTLLDRLPGASGGDREQLTTLAAELKGTREHLEEDVRMCGDPERDPADVDGLRAHQALARLTQMREDLARQIDAAVMAGRLPPRRLERATACPEPPAGRDGPDRARPALRSIPDVAAYYPGEARHHVVEGIVRIHVSYDAAGCVGSAEVVASSGSDALDEAAMQVALLAEMEPAVKDGESIGGEATLPLRFTLQGVDDQPADQPQP